MIELLQMVQKSIAIQWGHLILEYYAGRHQNRPLINKTEQNYIWGRPTDLTKLIWYFTGFCFTIREWKKLWLTKSNRKSTVFTVYNTKNDHLYIPSSILKEKKLSENQRFYRFHVYNTANAFPFSNPTRYIILVTFTFIISFYLPH